MEIVHSANLLEKSALAGLIRDLGGCCLDIGARGGFLTDLQPMAFAIDAVGFEPEETECRRLNRLAARNARPWKSLRFIPVGLSAAGGQRTLHMTAHPGSTTLLTPKAEVGRQYRRQAYFSVIEKRAVKTLTLNDALRRYTIPAPRFVKIDIEGAEYEVLKAAENILPSLAGLRTEISFKQRHEGQKRFSDIDRLLWNSGFEPVCLIDPIYWRRTGRGIDHPHIAAGDVPYSRGEMIHADMLYLKIPPAGEVSGVEAVGQLLRCALVACCYGLMDYAAAIFMRRDVAEFLDAKYHLEARQVARSTSRLLYRDYIKLQVKALPLRTKRLAKLLIMFWRDAAAIMKCKVRPDA